jgi:hypothetical protein
MVLGPLQAIVYGDSDRSCAKPAYIRSSTYEDAMGPDGRMAWTGIKPVLYPDVVSPSTLIVH